MTRFTVAGSFAIAAISLGAASMSFAQAPSTQACISAPGLTQLLCGVNSTEPTAFSGTEIGVGGLALGSGAAAALAQFGTLKASSSATALASSSGASALALVRDSLAISSPGLDGRQGFVDFRIDYSWLFSNDTSSSNGQFNFADVTLEFGAGGAYARQQISQGERPGTVVSQLVPIGLLGDNHTALDAQLGSFFEVRMPFVFGVEYNFRQSLQVASQSFDGATASIDAFNSAYWGGMVVRDENLGLVAFTADSGSGTDYTRSYAPVPEPATWLLAALGLMALGAHRRLRQGRTTAS